MIAQNRAPGLRHNFASAKVAVDSSERYGVGLQEAIALGNPESSLRRIPLISMSDVLEIAEENAALAGYPQLNFKRADFRDLDFSQFENLLLLQSPYGSAEDEEVQKVYTWNWGKEFVRPKLLFVFDHVNEGSRFFGRRADKNRKLLMGRFVLFIL